MERYLELCKRHKEVMDTKNIIVSVYTNASGFLWSMCKVDSGTDLGWSDERGDHEWSASFTSWENAMEDALGLIDLCDLVQFEKEVPNNKFHWGNYVGFISKKKPFVKNGRERKSKKTV